MTAAVILIAIFITVFIYKWVTKAPTPPSQAQCVQQQVLSIQNSDAEVHNYLCQRGRSETWQGYEVWLYERNQDQWLRIATAEDQECLAMDTRNNGSLTLLYNGSRGGVHVAKSSVIYTSSNNKPATLSVHTQRIDACSRP